MSKTENQKMFSERRQELINRQLSNSESQDRAVLTLSSSGLVLSVSFIRFVVELEAAVYTWLLYASWGLFATAVISTILSYLVGQKAINDSIEVSYKYYIEDDDDYQDVIPVSSKVNDKVNLISSVSFMFAVVTVALFIALNVNPKEASMAKNQDNKTFVQDSALVPKMEKKSANIPKQEQKPKPAPPADKN
ncbi:hypothetical protein [uncultured Marinobacter sp.]|uniref:hypothetical protein n=1 Tax=uncultured Marinobacter sp. TaxID=187379 RepID=UPI0025938478|nr:hypothetical protein [uncultured Marinobacter sp.]